MRLLTMTLCSIVALSCVPTGDEPPKPAEKPERRERAFYLGGIQIQEESPETWFENLEHQGMNSVQVTEYARHGEWDSADLSWDDENPKVLEEIRGAKAQGLSVVLVLRVNLDPELERNAHLWHGMIMPKDDQALDAWFERFRLFCLKWAEIAEHEGVEVLMLGSELNALATTRPTAHLPILEEYFLNEEKQEARRREVIQRREKIEDTELSLNEQESFKSIESYLEKRIKNEQDWARVMVSHAETLEDAVENMNARRAKLEDHWTELIEIIRGTYSGQLGYSANFDQFQDVGFWSQLDIMGVNAYFKLRHQIFDTFDGEALYPLLVEGWSKALGSIEEVRAEQGIGDLPVIFTELGYTWRRRSTLEPWSYSGFSVIPQGDGERKVVVWNEEPREPRERALAIRALHEAHGALESPFLRGLLYWKLSSHTYHEKDEVFMLHIGQDSEDPALPALRRFVGGPDPG